MKLTTAQLDDIEAKAKAQLPVPWAEPITVHKADPVTTLALVAEVRKLRAQRDQVIKESRNAEQHYRTSKDHFARGIVSQARATLATLGDPS